MLKFMSKIGKRLKKYGLLGSVARRKTWQHCSALCCIWTNPTTSGTEVSNSNPREILACSFQMYLYSNTAESNDQITSSACYQVRKRPGNKLLMHLKAVGQQLCRTGVGHPWSRSCLAMIHSAMFGQHLISHVKHGGDLKKIKVSIFTKITDYYFCHNEAALFAT